MTIEEKGKKAVLGHGAKCLAWFVIFIGLLKTKITQELNSKCPFKSLCELDLPSKLMQKYFEDG